VALENLTKRLAAIKRLQVKFTVYTLAFTAAWYFVLLFWMRDVQRANFAFTSTFQYLVVAWTCWVMYPYFLRVEAKQDAAIAIGHDSVDILAKVDAALDSRLERFDKMMGRIEKMTDSAEEGKHPVLDRFERIFKGEMEKLRAEIRAERGAVEDELGGALAEGEAAAADVGCPLCDQAHVGPCLSPTGEPKDCTVCGNFHDDFRCPECTLCQTAAGPHVHGV